MLRQSIILSAIIMIMVPASQSSASSFGDDFSLCAVNSANSDENNDISRWVVSTFTLSPPIGEIITIPDAIRAETKKKAAATIVKILFEKCRSEAVAAIANDGNSSLDKAISAIVQAATNRVSLSQQAKTEQQAAMVSIKDGMGAIMKAAIPPTPREKRYTERSALVRQQVETAHGIIARFIEDEKAGRSTRYDAQKGALAAIRGARYGDGEFFTIFDMAGRAVLHPLRPDVEGKDFLQVVDPNGVRFVELMRDAASKRGADFVSYVWPKVGQTVPVRKIAYVKLIPDWGWFVTSAVYADDNGDAKEAQADSLRRMIGGGGR